MTPRGVASGVGADDESRMGIFHREERRSGDQKEILGFESKKLIPISPPSLLAVKVPLSFDAAAGEAR